MRMKTSDLGGKGMVDITSLTSPLEDCGIFRFTGVLETYGVTMVGTIDRCGQGTKPGSSRILSLKCYVDLIDLLSHDAV